ncbi:unnamed protein product [Phytophthora fragariaefolia]|uniref:Unnamed protein product n=1 Tax=Phytophthora fragariaefolia TaxID=1490495 RepID=A0A9W6X429_9STRA|nr:unnamed protein product [Phytophthora fragariaefolia]
MSRPPTTLSAESKQSGRTAGHRIAVAAETSLAEGSIEPYATTTQTDPSVSLGCVRRVEALITLTTTATSVADGESRCPTPATRQLKLGGPNRAATVSLPTSRRRDCVYAFVGESKWLKTHRREDANEVKTMEIEKERNGSFGGGEIDERKYDEWNGDS